MSVSTTSNASDVLVRVGAPGYYCDVLGWRLSWSGTTLIKGGSRTLVYGCVVRPQPSRKRSWVVYSYSGESV